MSDTIGRIEVPELAPVSGAFPFTTDFAHGQAVKRQVITHLFASPTGKVEQSFYVGPPAPRYTFVRRTLTNANRVALAQWWQDTQGGVLPFEYDVPNADQSFTTKTVRFEDAPLTFEDLAGSICSCGLTFVEIPDPEDAPEYATASAGIVTRFPDAILADALLEGVQEIIPLVRIVPAESLSDPSNCPEIYLSDRRVTVDGQLYQPRLVDVPDIHGDLLMGQTIDGSIDDVKFTFGNADRVMIQLANDTELKWARIELSLYHVQTGYLLNLWAGRIVDWSSDAGPEFVVSASDPLSALTLSSPVGTCSRNCWRRYGQDGCPALVGTQDLDTTHFPDASADSCDLGLDTPNGCLAHSGGDNPTKYSFGAMVINPEGVKILDNSTGHWGLGRQGITPTSQINDSVWGQPLPEIWHHDDGIPQRGLPVACRVIAGREESDFYDALGVVGRGPLGAFTAAAMVDTNLDGQNDTFIGSTLDGQPHHGWHVDDNNNPDGTYLGLRQVPGTDPAGAGDFFSLSRSGASPDSWREVVGGSSVYKDTYAAGVAFMEIRRVDEKGVQLSTPQSHSMQAMVSRGLTGRTWSAPGTRVDVAGCTNPFWVAVNTYLRALGLIGEDASTQEEYFDVAAAITCAADADTAVPSLYGTTLTPNPTDPITDSFYALAPQMAFLLSKIPLSTPTATVEGVPQSLTWTTGSIFVSLDSMSVGNVVFTYEAANGTYTADAPGTERQFRFKGTIDSRKPTRDWIRDILNNGLGYFTWSFGKLRLGIRISATPVTSFHSGNMLWGSLHLEPIKPQFEQLTCKFADEEYLFAANTVDYTDQDHAARHGRIQNPLASEFGLVGSSTKSQAARLCVVRTREELGGVTEAEQKAARLAAWKSTILALDTEAGQVVGLYDDDLQNGHGRFRIQSWRLNRDWSVDISAKTVTPSMYDLTQGTAPAAVSESPQPVPATIPGQDPTVIQIFTANGE